MEDMKYTLARRMGISLSAEDADIVFSCADGSAALLYCTYCVTAASFRSQGRQDLNIPSGK